MGKTTIEIKGTGAKREMKPKTYLANAFSLQMLDLNQKIGVEISPITAEKAKKILSNGFISAIGHNDTANVVSNILETEISMNRISLSLTKFDTLIVAQIVGGRLPEGSTTLPEGFQMQFMEVRII